MSVLKGGEASRIGQVRPENQDNLVVAEDKQLFAVADGMGGHRGGEVASEVAAETLEATFTDFSTEGLAQAVQASNSAVVSTADGDSSLKGMGTTMCALALVEVDGEERLAVANVGDSRLYLLKTGTDQLEQITEDHSLVETLYRQGQLTRAEAEVHPHRNILTRALGIESDVLVDLFELQPLPGDRYLICSDGLFNEVTEEHMAIVLRQHGDPQTAAGELARLADESGGRDNITVVVVDVEPEPGEDADPPDPDVDRIVKVERADDTPLDLPGGARARPGNPSGPPPPAAPDAVGREAGAPAAPQQTVPGSDGDSAPVQAQPTQGSTTPGLDASDRPVGAAAGASGSGISIGPSAVAPGRPVRPAASVPGHQRGTRFTWRVALFVVALFALLGVVGAAVVYFGTAGYYVGLEGGEVKIFQGVPGGVAFIKPTVVDQTGIRFDDVPQQFRQDLTSGFKVKTKEDAERYVQSIRDTQRAIRQQSLGASAGKLDDTPGSAPGTSTPGATDRPTGAGSPTVTAQDGMTPGTSILGGTPQPSGP